MIFGEGPIIKNIAGDLNKLFIQGSRVNQPINNVEGDAAADQGMRDILAARDPVIQEISVGMSGEQSARYTVSGTPPLSLPNSLGKPLKAWEVEVSPYQEGSGDPAPDNVRAIHGTDKVTITTAGKNLCSSKLYQKSSTAICVGQDNATDYTFALIAGQTYTISAVSTISPDVYLREENEQQGVLLGNGLPKSFTPSVTGNYRIALAKGEGISVDDFSDVQVEFGSTATPYTPYLAPSQTVLTLPQTVYTGTIGSEGGESRWASKTIGDFQWRYFAPSFSYPYGFFYCNISEKAYGSLNIMCSEYKAREDFNANNTCFGNSTNNVVYIVDGDYSDPSEFVQARGGVQLVYERATPTTFAVPSVSIPTPTGTATTWATAEDGILESMEVTYIKSE